jgi:hypothetical protein
MGNLKLRFHIEGETDYVLVRWFKNSAPLTQATGLVNGTLVDQVVYPAPHSEESLLIDELDPVMYLVRWYRSVDGINPDVELINLSGDAGSRSEYSVSRFTYVVDRGYNNESPVSTGTQVWSDPVSNTIELRDERLANGKYYVKERGTGDIMDEEITDRTDAGGGFDWTVPEKVFNEGGVYFVYLLNRVDQVGDGSSGSGGGSGTSNIVLIEDDMDFTGAMLGKTLVASYTEFMKTLAMPNLLLIADGIIDIMTHDLIEEAQQYLAIQFDAGNTVNMLGDAYNVIYMGQGEHMRIQFKNNIAFILKAPEGYYTVGQPIYSYVQRKNTVLGIGTQYTQPNQPRLMQWIDMYGVPTVSEATWAALVSSEGVNEQINRGKFARDDAGAGTIRVPDFRDTATISLKYTDGTVDSERMSQGPGGYQQNRFKSHNHRHKGAYDSGYDGGGNNFLRIRSTNAFGSADAIEATGGLKTRIDSIGLLPLLCI